MNDRGEGLIVMTIAFPYQGIEVRNRIVTLLLRFLDSKFYRHEVLLQKTIVGAATLQSYCLEKSQRPLEHSCNICCTNLKAELNFRTPNGSRLS